MLFKREKFDELLEREKTLELLGGVPKEKVNALREALLSTSKSLHEEKKKHEELLNMYNGLVDDLCADDEGSQVVELSEIIALASAKKKGVCRVFPCKVGDVVWVIDTSHNRIRPQKVTSVHYWENSYQEDNHGFVETSYISEGGELSKRKRKFSDLGKTWFTSKEEAENYFLEGQDG